MKKTRPTEPLPLSALPEVLWESRGVRTPFPAGYRFKKRKGQVRTELGGGISLFSGVNYIREGFEVTWENPSPDLALALCRLSRTASRGEAIRIWIRQGERRDYKGYLVHISWSADVEVDIIDPRKPFRLRLWT